MVTEIANRDNYHYSVHTTNSASHGEAEQTQKKNTQWKGRQEKGDT